VRVRPDLVAAELGWTSLLVDEAHSVSGHGLVDLAVVAGPAGRAGPAGADHVVASAISRHGSDGQREALAGLLSGRQTAARCWAAPGAGPRATEVAGGWEL
jgi:alkylation response protein AidB-like acyl-CoA dehydrogenase